MFTKHTSSGYSINNEPEESKSRHRNSPYRVQFKQDLMEVWLAHATEDREMDKVGTVFWKCVNRTWGVTEWTHKITLDLWWWWGSPWPPLRLSTFWCSFVTLPLVQQTWSVQSVGCGRSDGVWLLRRGCKRCVSYWLPPRSFPVEKVSQRKVSRADHWGPYQQFHLRIEVRANSMRLFSVEATSSHSSTLDQLQPHMAS